VVFRSCQDEEREGGDGVRHYVLGDVWSDGGSSIGNYSAWQPMCCLEEWTGRFVGIDPNSDCKRVLICAGLAKVVASICWPPIHLGPYKYPIH